MLLQGLVHVEAVVNTSEVLVYGRESAESMFPIEVLDRQAQSITKDWALTYYAKHYPERNGMKEKINIPGGSFHYLTITQFSEWESRVLAIDNAFNAGKLKDMVTLDNGKKVCVYTSKDGLTRWNITEKEDCNQITLTIHDADSPFFMLSIYFKVTTSKEDKTRGQRYIVGKDSQYNQQNDTFRESWASFAPKSEMYTKIPMDKQGFLKSGKKVYLNVERKDTTYMHAINNKYKALAFVVEQSITENVILRAFPVIQQMIQEEGGVEEQKPSIPATPEEGEFELEIKRGA